MQRDKKLDLIKLVAIFGVIVIHTVSSVFSQNEIISRNFLTALFYGVAFRASVPLFLMVSGALMLDSSKEIKIKRLYGHNILRIIVAMLFWGFAYKLYHLLLQNQFNLQMVIYSLKRLILFDQEFHFYYIHMILIVYVFLPLTRTLVKNADKKLLEYTLLVFFLLGIVFPTVKEFKPFSLLSGLTNQWVINMTYQAIGYSVLGYYLKKYKISRKYAIISLFFGFLATFASTLYMSIKTGFLYENFLSGMSIGVYFLAVGVFSLIQISNKSLEGKLGKIAMYVSKASFCIYLCHMFVLYWLNSFQVTANSLPVIISVPLISVFVMLACAGIYALISKIPFLNKWIV